MYNRDKIFHNFKYAKVKKQKKKIKADTLTTIKKSNQKKDQKIKTNDRRV